MAAPRTASPSPIVPSALAASVSRSTSTHCELLAPGAVSAANAAPERSAMPNAALSNGSAPSAPTVRNCPVFGETTGVVPSSEPRVQASAQS